MKFALALPVLLLLGAAASVTAERSSFRASPPNRELQDDPCSIPFEDATVGLLGGLQSEFKPTYVKECLSSLSLNETLMSLHIDSLRQTFQQYYCFYNIINDPAASDPLSFQEELGYTLYSGANEGQVNLDQELLDLIEKVGSEGASVATFGEIATIFQKLYDAHVNLPPLVEPLGTIGGFQILNAYPERNLELDTAMLPTQFKPSYNNDGDLELHITFQSPNDPSILEVEKIESINGMSPYDFFLDLVSRPEFGGFWPYQSVGSRMNSAFGFIQPRQNGEAFLVVSSDPTALPDTFPVVYASGEVETYYTTAGFPRTNATDVYALFNAPLDWNIPGAAFTDFAILAVQVDNITASSEVKSLKTAPKSIDDLLPPPKPSATSRAGHNLQKGMFEFDEVSVLFDIFEGTFQPVAAISIEDDYAVLKVQTFGFIFDSQFPAVENPYGMIEIWANFTAAAKQAGVKKAIIDISGNGGGYAPNGDMLAISMYPFVPYEVFADQYDQNYNDLMLVTNETIFPIVKELAIQLTTNTTDTELQEFIDDLPQESIDQIGNTLLSVYAYCCGEVNITECATNINTQETCGPLNTLGETLATLEEFKNGPQLRSFLTSLVQNLVTYNAFNTVLGLSEGRITPDAISSVIRGGVPQNLTNKYPFLNEDEYYRTVAQTFQNDYMFDEYIVLSDGAAGSTTAIFSTKVQQLWNNRDTEWNGRGGVQPIPLTAVTYGGTKDPTDTTLAGFAASVQSVNVGVPIITAGLMYMLQFLLPPDLQPIIQLINEEIYQQYLPVPPYFADGLPRMPVVNYYSNFMEPGAIPMQYIKIGADKHIPQIYTGNTIANPSDLGDLYSEASKFFGSAPTDTNNNKPLPEEDSEDPAFMDMPEDSFEEVDSRSRKGGGPKKKKRGGGGPRKKGGPRNNSKGQTRRG